MKLFNWLSICLILLSVIFAGCLFGGDDKEDTLGPGGEDGNITAGFASMKVGSWEELTNSDGTRNRYEFIGKDTYNNIECYILEFDSIEGGKKSSTQIWLNASTGQGVLMVIKDENGKVTKMDIPQNYEVPTATGGETPVNATNLGKKKYTTPTGKTVDAIAYKITTPYGEVESWSSSQVPFGEVKTITNGKVMSELYDFGSSGAIRDISKQEAENAKPFGIGDIGDDQGGGDIGGGDDVGNGDDGGGFGNIQLGDIIITVGAGARPEIKTSKPIISLMIGGADFIWGFNFDDATSSQGPFKYGILPKNAKLIGVPNPPDLVAGTVYTVSVQGFGNSMGQLIFTR